MTASRRQVARALLVDGVETAPELLDVVREARARGLPAGLASRPPHVDSDLLELSLVDDLAGSRRLSREYFVAACGALRMPPARCLYIDTDDRAVSAARVAGLSAYRWNGIADLPYLRATMGLAAAED